MRVPVYLEVGARGATRAWVLSLPGVAVDGASPEAAGAAVPAGVAEEIGLLAQAGRPWSHAAEPHEYVETERVDTNVGLEEGSARALFKWDLRPTKPEDVVAALARIELARRAIEAAVAGTPDATVVESPVGSRLIALSGSMLWLLSRLGSKPTGTLSQEPLARFVGAEQIAIERLNNLLPGDLERHAVFLGEPWTTRKVLRRLTYLVRAESLVTAAP